ncbi:efflux RND transporter permease subunit, partial [uncultured Sphingomonas sp.]|uniref:efflux RND transporter permease subunit n=1 Tax=uncultured Sphingomonas sp. TaxID=158754 RepID=UPI0035CB426A
MTSATWSIRNPIPATLLFVLLSVAGIWGFIGLPVQNLPDLELPTVTITMNEPGAAPAQLETDVARKVEDSLATVTGLRHIRTTIGDGVVLMRVEFALEKPLSDAVIDTKNAVDRIRSDLPTALLEPAVSPAAFGSSPTLVYSARSGRMDEEALSWFVDDTVAKAVLAVPGVDRIERLGGVRREVRVDVDPVRLASLGVTAGDVSRALRQVQQQSSGGRGQLGGAEQSIRTTALVAQASDLGALPIVLGDARQVRLDQLATVRDAVEERTQAALFDGRPALGFNIYRAKGFDETQVAVGVKKALDRLGATTPGLAFTPISGSVDYTQQQYRGSMDMLYGGSILAIIVVWLFLRDWRATFVAATALPLSILPAFAAMRWMGYSLNTLTLLALSVVVGILVDDAIVEIENIERHRRMGKSARAATEAAVVEIALAVTATTMSLIAVFLPTALMTGVPGLLFRQFGWTAVIAVFASLLVARLLTPLMAVRLLRSTPPAEAPDGRLMSLYLVSIRWCLGHPGPTMAATALFMALSLSLLPLLPTGFMPASDRGTSNVSVELPPGSSLPSTLRAAEAARRSLAGVPGIKSVFTTVGQSGEPGQKLGEVRQASLIVTLLPRGERAGQAVIDPLSLCYTSGQG